jgi:hypothetical protein
VTAEPAGSPGLRTIAARAARCGHYCWIEGQLFALAGAAASAPTESAADGTDDPGARVFLSTLAQRHGALAAAWRDRLPVRAGVDAGALVVPPTGPAAAVVGVLAEAPDARALLGALTADVLPRLLAAYEADLAGSSAVSEGPVQAVLLGALAEGDREIEAAAALLVREVTGGRAGGEKTGETGGWDSRLAVCWETRNGGLFPAAWPS